MPDTVLVEDVIRRLASAKQEEMREEELPILKDADQSDSARKDGG